MRHTKAEAEKKLVEDILKSGLEKYYEMAEGKNTYYQFNLKDGKVRYWVNLLEESRKKLGLNE